MSSSSSSAWNPPVAFSPFLSNVWSPKSSFPPSIFPLPFLSSTSIPSSLLIHALFSAKPLLSRSKYVPFFTSVVSIPSPSRSRARGSTLPWIPAACATILSVFSLAPSSTTLPISQFMNSYVASPNAFETSYTISTTFSVAPKAIAPPIIAPTTAPGTPATAAPNPIK